MPSVSAIALALGAASMAAAGSANMQARAASASSSAAASGTGSSTLPTITTNGNAFYSGNDRFYIRGVDYQPGGSSNASDPLADFSVCSRDIPYFKQLGLNTIRVYTVDNSANHDQCMQMLAENGIYLALDVNNPKYSINRATPGMSYNPTYLQSVFATIDAFAGYSNTLLFFSGNEVINAANSTAAAPYVKAVTRDMKQYIGERGYRKIPVGYSAADVSQNQYLMAQYMDCGDAPSISDFYSINNYEWCDPSSFQKSGWEALVQLYSNYSLPLFLSEYGCITNTRTFNETVALYQPDMTKAVSGGLVYEFFEEGNGYGLYNLNGNSLDPVGNQPTLLKNALASVQDPSGNGGATTSNTQAQPCPPQSSDWDTSPFSGSALPAMPSGAEMYMKNGAGKGPGLNGAGSQDAPGGSTATASAGAGSVTATYGSGASATGASSSSTHKGAAGPLPRADFAPLICGGVVLVSMLFGTALL